MLNLKVSTGFLLLILLTAACRKEHIAKPPHISTTSDSAGATLTSIDVSRPVCQEVSSHFYSDARHAKSFFWQFGDGTSSTQEAPEHVYSGLGSYTVQLTINGDSALSASMAIIVERSPTYVRLLEGAHLWHHFFDKGYVGGGIDSAIDLGDTTFAIFYINPYAISVDGDILKSPLGYSDDMTFTYVPASNTKPFFAKMLHLKHGTTDSVDYTIFLKRDDGKVDLYTFP
jgi:hypothetical protein